MTYVLQQKWEEAAKDGFKAKKNCPANDPDEAKIDQLNLTLSKKLWDAGKKIDPLTGEVTAVDLSR
jgi:hypothetical protein